jgi:hypothetical protein
MTMMVCGVLSVWLAARIATRTVQGQPVSAIPYLALGLAAGLGWWSNQLVTAFLIVAGFVLLSAFRWRMVREGLFSAILAFFVGSAPWWIWNVYHEWGTFDFGHSLGKVTFLTGIRAFGSLFLGVAGLPSLEGVWNAIRLLLLALALMLFLVALARDRVQGKHSDRFFFRLAAPLLVVLVMIVGSTSHYILFRDAYHYLMPVFPAVAVMMAVGAVRFLETQRLPMAWIVPVLLIPAIFYPLPHMARNLVSDRTAWLKAERLADAIEPRSEGICIGPYSLYWMNFASGERLRIAGLPKERYAPYAVEAELAEQPAFLDDYRGLRSFLAYTGGRSLQTAVDGVQVDYGLTPPPNDWRYVETAAVVDLQDTKNRLCRELLSDSIMDTCWTMPVESREPVGLTVEFDRARPLCGVRFVSPNAGAPRHIEIEGRVAGNMEWQPLLPPTKARGYFWSGSYVQLEGPQLFQEIRFAAPTGGVDRLRLTFRMGDSGPHVLSLAEVLFLEASAVPGGDSLSVDACLTALRVNGVKRFVGPRWMTEQVAYRMGEAVETGMSSLVRRSIQALPAEGSVRAGKVSFAETTGLLVDARDAGRTRDVLGRNGLRWDEVSLGGCVLMVAPKAASVDDAGGYVFAYWTEQGCFAADSRRFAKRKAQSLCRKAEAQQRSGDLEGMRATLNEVLRTYPGHQSARRSLATALESAGRQEEAAAHTAELKRQIEPAIQAQIRFPKDVEFLGLDISPKEAVPGQTIEIAYFWKCPPTVDTRTMAVFVHMEREKERFQDDHVLLEDVSPENLRYQPFPEIFSYTRRIVVPASVSPGDYRMVIGLFRRNDNHRLSPTTDLKQKRSAVELPVMLTVRNP